MILVIYDILDPAAVIDKIDFLFRSNIRPGFVDIIELYIILRFDRFIIDHFRIGIYGNRIREFFRLVIIGKKSKRVFNNRLADLFEKKGVSYTE